jgi:bacillithiol biosynthesis cysteine-adding enzyme BshC
MPKHTLSYSETGHFSKLICDYLAEDESLKQFFGNFPNLKNFGGQLNEKKESFNLASRTSLVKALQKQYKNIKTSEATGKNINLLSEANTFTITTGHQLNLFTGPLYFLYKIFSVINLSEKLKEAYPKNNFVPIYWMATEDHDFDEINYFNLFGKKIAWNRQSSGAVGELSTEGLEDVLKVFEGALGSGDNAKKLNVLFAKAYTKHSNLTEATRYLGNELFSDYGLVIVDGNDVTLKRVMIPFYEKEMLQNLSFKKVTETTQRLTSLGYPEQVHPREINLFYLIKGKRERITEKDGSFFVNDNEISFSRDDMIAELNAHPERFSPNALLRPLYQEVILPNLCYIGGGGELAYWFQLKDYFECVEVPFPIILLRNSVLLVPAVFSKKLAKFNVEMSSLFLPRHELEAAYTKQISEIPVDFSKQKEYLVQQFKALHELAKQTDASFSGAVAAQEKKQLNGLRNLEKRLLKAQKRKFKDQLERLGLIQDELFPKQSLQERSVNFSQFYLDYGDRLLSELKENLDPLSQEFTILEL